MRLGQVAWNKGIPASVETRAKMSAAEMGHIVSSETRAKISVAHMGVGHVNSPETRAKLSAAGMGHAPSGPKHHTVESRVKMSGAQRGHRESPETRAKLSMAKMGPLNPNWGKDGDLSFHWKGGPAVWVRKGNAKRRLLGFNPLNSWFPGCEAHHINNGDVIHMLKKLHRSICHNQTTGKGMAAMNALAGAFLTEDWT